MTVEQIFLLPLVGLASGFLGATVGSGGIVALPLIIFLGFDPKVAVASLILSDVLTFTLAFYKYKKAQQIEWRLGFQISAVVVVGSIVGTQLMLVLNVQLVKQLIGLVILLFLPLVLLTKFQSHENIQSPRRGGLFICLSLIFVQSIIAPIVPAGGATLVLLLVVVLIRLQLLRAYATITLPELVMHVVTSLIYLYYGYVDLLLALFLAVGAGLGSWLGASSAISKGNNWLRGLVLLVGVAGAFKLIFL